MAISRTLLLLFILAASAAQANPIRVGGQIRGEGGAAVGDLKVRLDGNPVTVDAAGNFSLVVESDSAGTAQLTVEADGYYTALQTLHASDFQNTAMSTLPAIALVKRQAGRRLILFAGDAMLSRRYFRPLPGEPVLVKQSAVEADSKALLQHVKPYIELADFTSVNLETQLSKEKLTDRLPKSVTFYSPPELATVLKWAGFDYVALGNNHLYDYQDAGLRSTLNVLDRSGLLYSGAGFDDADARKPAQAKINGVEHSLLSYVGWPGTFSPSQSAEKNKGGAALGNSRVIAEDLRALPRDTTAILQLHAGLEYSAHPAVSEQTTLRQAVVDGADLVLGHHAHVLQGFEIYNDRLIAYSMGNFLFDQYHYTTQLGMLLFVWMDDDRLHRAEVVPMHVNGYVPTPATGAFRYSILHRLARLSDSASACMTPNGLHASIEVCNSSDTAREQRVDVGSGYGDVLPVALRDLGASPLLPVSVKNVPKPYRLGTDILRLGDFEYSGLFGTRDRTWIENTETRVVNYDGKRLQVELRNGNTATRTGQKVFERIFTASSPATVSGHIRVAGNVRLRVLLQRRRVDEEISDALANGPLTEIGSETFSSGGENAFVFDYNQPRIQTRSVRLLFEIEDLDGTGATVSIDDINWIEWTTPWRQATEPAAPEFATHLQFQ